MLPSGVTEGLWAQKADAKERREGCSPNLPSDACSARRCSSAPALQCHMSLYALRCAPFGTCVANAWGVGMEVWQTWGLLTSFPIFRRSLYPMMPNIFLKPMRGKTNTLACLSQPFPTLAFNLYIRLKYIFYNLLRDSRVQSWFVYVGPPSPTESRRSSSSLRASTHSPQTSFPLLSPNERAPSAQTGLSAAAFEIRTLMTTTQTWVFSHLFWRDGFYTRRNYSLPQYLGPNYIHCMLTISCHRDPHFPPNDKLKASLQQRISQERRLFYPGTICLQTVVFLTPQLK